MLPKCIDDLAFQGSRRCQGIPSSWHIPVLLLSPLPSAILSARRWSSLTWDGILSRNTTGKVLPLHPFSCNAPPNILQHLPGGINGVTRINEEILAEWVKRFDDRHLRGPANLFDEWYNSLFFRLVSL
jgi:hypothetical protein